MSNALVQLADIANCTAGDLHLLHLQYKGIEFDSMHKKVLKKYYEQAAEDYDTWAEAALMFENCTLNSPNDSATRINWQSISCTDGVDRARAITEVNSLLETYVAALLLVYTKLEEEKTAICVGIANTVQTRLEYWTKELCYFNDRRVQ